MLCRQNQLLWSTATRSGAEQVHDMYRPRVCSNLLDGDGLTVDMDSPSPHVVRHLRSALLIKPAGSGNIYHLAQVMSSSQAGIESMGCAVCCRDPVCTKQPQSCSHGSHS